jgi:Skp family chaperone for outer membrane proteins
MEPSSFYSAVNPDAASSASPTPAPAATTDAPSAPITGQPTQATQPSQPTQATPTAATPTAQAAPPQNPNAPATAPARALPPSRNTSVHGVLGSVLLGALAGAAAHVARTSGKIATAPARAVENVGKGIGQGFKNFAANSPYAQQLKNESLARQAEQQKMQQESLASMDAHTRDQMEVGLLSAQVYHATLENQKLDQDQKDALTQDQAAFNSWLSTNGHDLDTTHQEGFANLTSQHSADNVAGKIAPVSNGQTGDKAGFGFMNVAMAKSTPIPSDFKFVSSWKVDPKSGELVPAETQTIKADGHTTFWDAYQTHLYSQKQGLQTQEAFDAAQKSRSDAAAAIKAENEALSPTAQQKADSVYQALNVPDSLAGDKAPAMAAQLQSIVNDPTTAQNPVRLAQAQRALGVATNAMQIAGKQKAAQSELEQSIKDGDPAAAGKLLASGLVAPSQIISSRKPEFATQAFAAAQKADPTWNAKKAEADYKIAGNQQNATFFGSANSLLDQGGTLDQLTALQSSLPQGKFPKLNTVQDWYALQTGGGPMAGYASVALGVADDYGKVMGGGTASDNARDSVLKNLAAAQSPAQFKSTVDGIRSAVQSQKRARIGRNPVLQSMYDGDASTQSSPNPQSPVLPPQAISQLKEGHDTTFANGQVWTLQNGQPVQVTK